MQSNIEKSFTVHEPADKVWTFLRDPRRVVTCVPGAQLTEQIDDKTYKGEVGMKVGPVVTHFSGEIHIDGLDDERRELRISGTGADTGGKGSASMQMVGRVTAKDDGTTEVFNSMEITVVGRLAQFGSRMMQDISNRMFAQFTDCLAQNLATMEADAAGAAPEAPAPAPIKALPLFFAALWAAIKRLFGRG